MATVRQALDTRYRIIKPVGSGGMAEVYLAHDELLDRDVALKVLSQRFADDDELVERFRREAQSAATLSHRNIVSIYDRGETEDSTYYILMEYVTGGTLKERILRQGLLPPRTAASVAIQVAQALEEAHRLGVIHRDIKPQNILITGSGDVKVGDFGIAKAASSSTMTRTGVVLGTAHYISPEQAMGEPLSSQSDLYSLGVVLYEMLTGTLPYDAETPIGIAMKHVNGNLVPPREVNPEVPEGINAITLRLLAKDPKERYSTAASLLEDLERAEQGLALAASTTKRLEQAPAPIVVSGRASTRQTRTGAPPSSPLHRRKKWRRRIFPWVVAATLLATLVVLGGVSWGFWQGSREPNDASVLEAPSLVKVPDVTGWSLEEASRILGEAGLTVDQKHDTLESKEPEGTVLSIDPAAGSEVEVGTSVTLTVSRGTPKEGTAGLNVSTGRGTTPKTTPTEPNTQQPGPTSLSSPAPAPRPAVQQSNLEQSAEDGEQVLENRKETQKEVQEEIREGQERVSKGDEATQEKGQGRAENAGEDRVDD